MYNMIIRKPETVEYPEVVTVINSEKDTWAQAFSDGELRQLGIGEETIEDLVAGESLRQYLVAENEGKLVGFASWYPKTQQAAWISMLQVLPECQGQGIGTQLLHAIEMKAKEQGLQAVALETQKKATWATQFYLVRGYSYLTNETASEPPFTGVLSRPLSDDLAYVVMGKILD